MKLQQGDYVTDLTEEQFDELQDIENFHGGRLPYYNDKEDGKVFFANGLVYDEHLYHSRKDSCKNHLTFTEFKQRAINTFER